MPRGPRRRESEPIAGDPDLHKTYDSDKPSYDSYKPREQSSAQPRRRPTAEEYWDQHHSPVTVVRGRAVRESPGLNSKEHRSSVPPLSGTRGSREAFTASPGDPHSCQQDQGRTQHDGVKNKQGDVARSSIMDIDEPASGGSLKRLTSNGLRVNTELQETLGSNMNRKYSENPLMC